VSEPPSLWRLKDRRSALRRPLCLLLFGFLCTSRRGRGCCLHACVTGRYGPAGSRCADLARSADAGWAARALTRGALLSQDRCAEEPDSGSEKKSLFHVRPLGWSLQDGACVVRAGHGRGITRMPLGLNARQKPGFLSGIEAFGNTRAHAHANMRSSHQSPLWNGNRLLRTVCSQVLEASLAEPGVTA